MTNEQLRATLDLNLPAFEGMYNGDVAVVRAQTTLSNLRVADYSWPTDDKIWSGWQLGSGRGPGYTSGVGPLVPEFVVIEPVEITGQPTTATRSGNAP